MDEQRVRDLKEEAEADLCGVETEFKKLEARRNALSQVVSGYQTILSMFSPAKPTQHAAADGLPLLKSSVIRQPLRSGENLTTRSVRILKSVAPRYLTPRELLKELVDDGWTTSSENKIGIVRNTMTELVKRIEEVDKRANDDGTVGYAFVDKIANQNGSG